MPVWTPSAKQSLFNGGGDATGGPKGQRATFLWDTQGRGIPRRADLLTIRALEESHAVSLPIDTVLTQITTTDFTFTPPDGVEPTTEHEEARDDLLEWFEGDFNDNGESFDHFLKKLGGDLLALDAGVIEKVPDPETGFVDQMYARDGATFVKNPDDHGRLPEPDSGVPAYFQFSLSSSRRPFARNTPLGEIAEHVGELGYSTKSHEPIPFTRDELTWIEESPKSWKPYGTGRVQKVRMLAESVLNMDISNRKHFDSNEIPEGVLSIVDANSKEIKRTREYWQEEVQGSEHKLPILGGEAEYQTFRASPTELNFLDSQNWYHKLIWMIFGLSQSEVGLIEDVNRSAHSEASTAVWRKTTKPLLELLERRINTEILPFHPVYHRLDGDIRFSWNYDNPAVRQAERERQRKSLETGTATINEVRQQRGEENLEWGDWPLELVRSVARNHPDWMLEQLGVEDPPASGVGGGDPFGLSAVDSDTDLDHDADADGTDADRAEKYAVARSAVEESLADGGTKNGHSGVDKDPLRNEGQGGVFEYPPLKSHLEQLSTQVGAKYDDERDDLADALEDVFPDERLDDADELAAPGSRTKGLAVDVGSVISQIGLSKTLTRVVSQANLEAMDITADFEASQLEDEIEEQLEEDDAAVSIGFDVEDSQARQAMEKRAAQNMVTVEATVKDRIRNTLTDVADDGGNVNDARQALDDTFDQLTTDHAQLVARTETLSSSRYGSQAMAETSDVIGGKEWLASSDGRTRTWHAEMEGTVELVDDDFVVPDTGDDEQPPDYPRTASVVGEDQPFNCRCVQRAVLEEDLPDGLRELAAVDGVTVTRAGEPVDALTERQLEIKSEHALEGETFVELLERAYADVGSVEGLKRELGIGSKHTVYKWLDAELGVSR